MKLLLKLWYLKLWSPSISWSGINNIDSDQEGTVLTCTATRLTYFLQGESDRGNGLERRGRKICTRIDFYYFFFFFKKQKANFAFGERSPFYGEMLFFLDDRWTVTTIGTIPILSSFSANSSLHPFHALSRRVT